MKTIRNWMMWAALGCGTVLGTSCTTDLRDAVITGAYDFVTATTNLTLDSLWQAIVNGGQQAEAAQE